MKKYIVILILLMNCDNLTAMEIEKKRNSDKKQQYNIILDESIYDPKISDHDPLVELGVYYLMNLRERQKSNKLFNKIMKKH